MAQALVVGAYAIRVQKLYFSRVMYTDDVHMLGKGKVSAVDRYHDMDTDIGIRGENQ
jgi:hypothetical protein